jgi:hypothetical protein
MLAMADQLVKSGLLPSSIKSPAAALAIIQKGRELGIPPMYALNNISVIQGRTVTSAELMLAMIYRDHGDGAIQFEETTDERCVVLYKRRSWASPRRFEWSWDDAKRANLIGKDVWKAYPPAMLRARCISAVARIGFPDTIGGMHTHEEMGGEVEVTDSGEIIPVQPTAVLRTVEPEQPARTTFSGFAYASPDDREDAIDEYCRLAEVASRRGHPKAERIVGKDPRDLKDGELEAAVKSLLRWESSLTPAAEVDATNAAEYES